jgi:AraC family transcriptional regulator
LNNDLIMSIHQAMNYIYKNLDKTLTVEEIAGKCCFSQYHFNRVFKLIVGENIYSFIKRMKLEYAAFQMKTSNRSITDIAAEVGYSSSNFASAFKQYFGVSASAFKKMNVAPCKDSFSGVVEHIRNLKKNEKIFAEIDAKMKIKEIAGMKLMYKRVICNYLRDLESAWENFCQEMEQRGLLKDTPRFVGISYDDPLIIHEDRCVYDICMEVDEVSGMNVHQIEAGRYACFAFYDTLDKLILAFNEIFSLWLPFCRHELDNRPSLEIYHSGLDENKKISVEICIPIQSL